VDVHPYYQRGADLSGVGFAWIKMADGAAVYSKTVNGVRYTADEHARRLRVAGRPFGGYEFAEPGTDGARAADVLWAECRRLGATGVAPAVDIEGSGWTPASAQARGRAFCARMRQKGVRPAVYMDLSMLQTCRPDLWPENPVIWAPRYGALPQVNGRYTGRYDVHQYTSSGSLPGSAGAVDFNQAYGSAHLITSQEAPDMDATQAGQLGHLDAVAQRYRTDMVTGGEMKDGVWYADYGEVLRATYVRQAKMDAKLDALAAALAAATKNPDITLDAVKAIVTDAVRQNIDITGELHVSAAQHTPTEG
jgi:GH25 family lysozyme M1 (1,4-beta-N-acetylmuramidase)